MGRALVNKVFVDDDSYSNFNSSLSNLKRQLEKKIQQKKQEEANKKVEGLQSEIEDLKNKIKAKEEVIVNDESLSKKTQTELPLQPTKEKPKWMFPLLLGGGGLVLGVIVYFALRKK